MSKETFNLVGVETSNE